MRNRLESKLISSGHSPNIYFGFVISVPRRASNDKAEEIEIYFSFNFYNKNRLCCTLDQSVALMRMCAHSIRADHVCAVSTKQWLTIEKVELVMLTKGGEGQLVRKN